MLGLLCLLVPCAPQQAPAAAPPGLLLVKGGKTTIGSTPDQVEKLVLEREELRDALAGETPQHVAQVDDFYLMPTEVTNEQYLAYVRATAARPPRSWGLKALQAGQAAFLEEQGRAKQDAKTAGKPFEAKLFDPDVWWDENWRDAAWEVQESELALPVVFVNYADALRYARWAGLRLMTEFEFQRAARGDSERLYPWGDAWDDKKYCQSLHIGRDLPAQVGSFPEGATGGVFDLAGNVWEWTASPFTAFPGYKQPRFTVKNRVIDCLAPFDPDQRVTVSGSFQMDRVGVRITTRKNTDRSQATNALGFRCAASPSPGLDAARWIIDQDVRQSALGPEAELAPERTAIRRSWRTEPGRARVAGYAMIRSYEQALACPRASLAASTPGDLDELTTRNGPQLIGLIDVPRPLSRPELDAGAYLIFWRGAGELPTIKADKASQNAASKDQDGPSFREVPGFAADKDCYLFYSVDGVAQVAVEAPPVTSEKNRPSSVKIEAFVPPPKPNAVPPTPHDTLRFSILVPSSTSRSKAFVFDLPIWVAPGALDGLE